MPNESIDQTVKDKQGTTQNPPDTESSVGNSKENLEIQQGVANLNVAENKPEGNKDEPKQKQGKPSRGAVSNHLLEEGWTAVRDPKTGFYYYVHKSTRY